MHTLSITRTRSLSLTRSPMSPFLHSPAAADASERESADKRGDSHGVHARVVIDVVVVVCSSVGVSGRRKCWRELWMEERDRVRRPRCIKANKAYDQKARSFWCRGKNSTFDCDDLAGSRLKPSPDMWYTPLWSYQKIAQAMNAEVESWW